MKKLTMNDHLAEKLKYLRLSGLLANWEHYLKLAADKNFSHARLLAYVLEQEYALKQDNSRTLRQKRARLPEPFVIETYPFQQQPKLNKKRLMELYDSLRYMRNHENILWLGTTGCGKTGLATSFLIHAANHGYSARFVTFPELVTQLYQSVADHSEQKIFKKYISYDCLLIDEVGLIEVEPVQAGLFFTLMQQRHRKKTTLITSNLGFGDWNSFLKNEHLALALIDRLTENTHVFNMKNCKSLRPVLDSST